MPNQLVNGLELHYALTGKGPCVVFLNGLAGDHLYWMGQVRAFRGQYKCLAIDNRDSGRSAYVDTKYSIADLAEDVAALVQTLGLGPVHLVGLSLGGMIAQELALRHPDAVRSLALICTLGRADEWFRDTLKIFGIIRRQVADTPAFFEALLPWLVSHRFYESASAVDWLRALLRQNPYSQRLDGFFRQLEAIHEHDTLEKLSEIRCPVLVATGEDDILIPPRYAHQLQSRLQSARLEILPGVGHGPPIENGRAFNRLLSSFFENMANHD